jgi:tetratricopeptide (TPR) repeat protein
LAIDRNIYGNQHRSVATDLRNLASLLRKQGKDSEAEPLLRDSLQINRKHAPPGHPSMSFALFHLGALLNDTGRAREAEPLLREAAQIRHKHFAHTPWMVALVDAELAGALIRSGRTAEGRPLLEASLATLRKARGPTSAETRQAERFLSAPRLHHR